VRANVVVDGKEYRWKGVQHLGHPVGRTNRSAARKGLAERSGNAMHVCHNFIDIVVRSLLRNGFYTWTQKERENTFDLSPGHGTKIRAGIDNSFDVCHPKSQMFDGDPTKAASVHGIAADEPSNHQENYTSLTGLRSLELTWAVT
jgi:hypothetical protein